MFLAIRRGHRGDTSAPERGGMKLPARKVSVERLQLATFPARWQETFRKGCSRDVSSRFLGNGSEDLAESRSSGFLHVAWRDGRGNDFGAP